MKSRLLNARARKHLALTLAAVRSIAQEQGVRVSRARQYHRAWQMLERHSEEAADAWLWGDVWDLTRAAHAAKSAASPEGAA